MAQRQYARPGVRRRRRRIPIPSRLVPILLTLAGALFLFSAGTVLWWSKDLPNPQNIDDRRVTESTKIFDRTGEHLLYEIGDVHRTTVSLDVISRHLRQATLAAEDDQFYEHHGLDFFGIARGLVLKPLTGKRVQGGSTITQQLIKNSILTSERTVRRKVKEAVLAIELEQRFSKDQIFEMYLNDIPYGSQAYGVEAAALTFFGVPASEVTLGQAAILSSLPKAPTYYSPYGSHFEDLKSRQENTLQRMVELDMVSQEQADEAKAEELDFSIRRESIRAPHFVFYIKELLDEEYGDSIVGQGGLTITTTLDADLQTIAETALSDRQETLNGLGASNAALAAIDPRSGDIVAMVGSVDYFNEEIDGNVNVSIRHRSPGSSIKPFVYAAAFAAGFTPDTVLIDAETDFGQEYKPKNYTLKEHGPVTMRQALANSLNIPAVKTLYLAGVRSATDLAQAMGMTSLNDPDRYGLSLVLGGGEVRLLDEVSAYGVFANDGVRLPHRAILKVESGSEVLFDAAEEADERTGDQVLDSQIARLVTSIISDNSARALAFGTNTPLQLGSRPVAAKTGTTQEFRDGWTMGFTPSLAAGVWVGNNDNTPMGDTAAGVVTAAPIWNAFMRGALAGTPIEEFVRPEPINNIQHSIMRGEVPELKAKFVAETGEVYSLECPVALGEPKTFKEIHNLLFYVRRSNPQGPPPANAENDPQYDKWKVGVEEFIKKHNEETKGDAEAVRYAGSLPEESCNIGNAEDLPNVRIVVPETTIVRGSSVRVRAEVDSPRELDYVRFMVDGEEVSRQTPRDFYEITFSFPSTFTGRKTVLILAVTKDKLVGRAHRTFIVNPDSSKPSATLLTPKNGSDLSGGSFPHTVKVTASDPSGIELVDVLYRKDGESGTKRIGRTSEQAPVAANRYEVVWGDSPGPGRYQVYVVAYDTTGNFVETTPHTVDIQ